MPNSKIVHPLIFAFFLLATLIIPVFALAYNSGVSVGQFVKYGNFVGIGPGFESINNTDYVKQEIIDVTGKQVTLFTTGQLKDGTATSGNGSTSVWNIETGTLNGVPSVQGTIIAANLNQGDPIPPPNTYTVNKTETRTYLGFSRSVNILNSTIATPDYTTLLTFVYDRASGMLLEASSLTTQNQPQPTPSEYSYSITQTNIFGTQQTTPVPSPTIPEYSSAAIVTTIILAGITATILTKKKIRKERMIG
jgi:hypothetical protein